MKVTSRSFQIIFVTSLAIILLSGGGFSGTFVSGATYPAAVRGGGQGGKVKGLKKKQQHHQESRKLFNQDGTITIDGSAVSATSPLPIFSTSDTSGTTEIRQFTTNPVAAGTTITCTISSCTVAARQAPTFQISIKYGGLFTSVSDGTVATGSNCPISISATTTTAQVGYVMLTQTSATGSVSSASYTCVTTTTASPTTPSPTPSPNTPAPTPAPTPSPVQVACSTTAPPVHKPSGSKDSGSKDNDDHYNDDHYNDDYSGGGGNDDYNDGYQGDEEDCPTFAEMMLSYVFGWS